MTLSLDGPPQVTDNVCDSCGRSYKWVCGFVARSDEAFAIYYAQCHGHQEAGEIWLDVVLGSWDEPAYADQVTFSCRIGPTGVGLVDAPRASKGEAPYSGLKLSRSAALASSRVEDLWAVVHFIADADHTVASYLDEG